MAFAITMTCEKCGKVEMKRFEHTRDIGWDYECSCGWTSMVCEMPLAEAEIEARQRFEDWASELAPPMSLDDAFAEIEMTAKQAAELKASGALVRPAFNAHTQGD